VDALLQDAVIQCELIARGFDVFTRPDHDRMVGKRAREIMRRKGEF
jgi:hypothetical protein